ncbi:hypothetical protein TsFJ059_009950 [Trichoderma semiorbis]|uniref:Uncharacterized protein n=1 Tax=Trichoderma semiorbis TaxID=1491008 RepID=A0A9P8HFC6_9HYPO|nr:hypothetical protein TsFJ059_009950 [Trichoderma semiorbis]
MADSGTIAAWAALAAALLALVVALAQATQQYAATAQDMKRCEKSVWGPMPGYAGRRVFLWRQIRFHIVFDVPNIFILTEYWEKPGNARQFPAHRITVLPAPFDPPSVNTDTESAIYNHSEACWVAFARQVSHVCPSAVRVGLMAGGADRLPADIPVVPMQVSLRDVIALGLMIGMRIQAASVDHFEMSGPFGFIKSSSHPILGSLIHFSAFSATPHIKGLKTGDVSKSWLRRLIGIASVAKQRFDEPKRRYYAATMMRWRTNSTRIPSKIENLDGDRRGRGKEVVESELKFVDLKGKEHTVPSDKCSTWQDLVQFLESNGIATAPYIILGPENKAVAPKSWKPLLKVVRKGDLKTIFKIAEGDYPPSPFATMSHSKSPSQEPSIKETTNQQILLDIDNITEHAARILEGPAGLVEASLAESAESITRAESPEPDRDISLDPLTQGDTTQNTAERDGHFLNQGSINLTNQTVSMQSKDLENRKEPLALTWVEDGTRRESLTNGSRVRVPEGPPPIRTQYRRPTVEDYGNSDLADSSSPSPSSSPSIRRRVSPRFRRGNRDSDSRSPSIRRRSPSRSHRENTNSDSRSPSFRSENSFDSEREWRNKQAMAYVSSETRWVDPDPPQLTFYWASQIDIELGCWATPWGLGLYKTCIDALGMMVDISLAGLSQTARLAQPKANRPAVGNNEIIYAEFPGALILGGLWLHLREGEQTWPPYAINGRGGVRGLATHSLVGHSAFRDDERLPQLTLLNSVHRARMSTAERSTASQILDRGRILELASIDFWLSYAAATNSISKGKSDLIINTPAIVEEIWLKFFHEIMSTRRELWNPGGGDMHIRKLANSISDFLSDFLGSPAEIYFVWVAFLRAIKVMECVADGPRTSSALGMFENDILVYLV